MFFDNVLFKILDKVLFMLLMLVFFFFGATTLKVTGTGIY